MMPAHQKAHPRTGTLRQTSSTPSQKPQVNKPEQDSLHNIGNPELSPAMIQSVQRLFGNQYAQRLVQQSRNAQKALPAPRRQTEGGSLIISSHHNHESGTIQRTFWIAQRTREGRLSWVEYKRTENTEGPPKYPPDHEGQIYDDNLNRYFDNEDDFNRVHRRHMPKPEEATPMSTEDVETLFALQGGSKRPHVVAIGGGPVGLMSAMEAKLSGAKSVTVVEKRLTYTRPNVPTLTANTLEEFRALGVYDELFTGEGHLGQLHREGGYVPIQVLEDVLSRKAREMGITIIKGYVFEAAEQYEKKQKRSNPVQVTLSKDQEQFDIAKINADAAPDTVTFVADLIIVAAGGGASRNTKLIKQLALEYEEVEAREYSAYGTFSKTEEAEDIGEEVLSYEHRPILKKIARGGIQYAFETPGHNYELVFFSGLTLEDIRQLNENPKLLHELLSMIGAGATKPGFTKLKSGSKSAMLFPVTIKRAKTPVSPRFPAIAIGDAAVTPHPFTGSGINKGIGSLPHLRKLVKNLKKGEKAFSKYERNVGAMTADSFLRGMAELVAAMRFTVKTLVTNPDAQSRFLEQLKVIDKVINDAGANPNEYEEYHRIAKSMIEDVYRQIYALVGKNKTLEEKMQALRKVVYAKEVDTKKSESNENKATMDLELSEDETTMDDEDGHTLSSESPSHDFEEAPDPLVKHVNNMQRLLQRIATELRVTIPDEIDNAARKRVLEIYRRYQDHPDPVESAFQTVKMDARFWELAKGKEENPV